MNSHFQHSNPPRNDPRTYPIDHNGRSAELRLHPIEGPESSFPGRPVGPILPRCKQKKCFNILLWITDDLKTSLPLGTVCGNCGESIKYPPKPPSFNEMWRDVLEYAQVKSYLIRMLEWELDTMMWGRNGKEYDEVVSKVYKSLVGNSSDVTRQLFNAFNQSDRELVRQEKLLRNRS